VNHPLRCDLVEQIYAEWADLFDNPAIEKCLVNPGGQIGWFPADTAETAPLPVPFHGCPRTGREDYQIGILVVSEGGLERPQH
tara:strand:- start:1170 stop:1418 length:249 start_codon:yes stop_codon:yes gene_type:complete